MRCFHARRCFLPLVFAVCLGCSGAAGDPSASGNPAPAAGNPAPPGSPVPPPSGSPLPPATTGPLTGVWSGSMQVTTGPAGQPAITVTATLDHTISNGQSTITGAVAVANTPCLTPATLPVTAGTFQDPNFTLDVPTSNSTLLIFGHLTDPNTLAAQFEIRGGTCDGTAGAGTLSKRTASASTAGLRVAFNIPQGGTYGGELWVLPSTFTILGCTVNVRAHAVDAAGTLQDVSATWAPEAPAMVLVSPSQGHQVTITALTAGTSNVRVSAAGFPSILLNIQAEPHLNNSLLCTFAQ